MAVLAVPVSLNGANHGLRYDFWAWAQLEDQGWPLPKLLEALQQETPPYKLVLLLVWAGLQHETSPPSQVEVGHWLDGESQFAALAAVGQALAAAFPVPSPGTSAEDTSRPFAGSTGRRSGARVRSPA